MTYRKISPGRKAKYTKTVLLRKRRPRRHYSIVHDPVVRPRLLRAKRRKADRKRKIQKTLERIMYLLPGGIEWSPYTDRIRAILEEVIR